MQQKLDQDRLQSQQAMAYMADQLKNLQEVKPPVRAVMEAGEQFSAATGESVVDWLHKVDRRGTAEGWSDLDKRRAAVGALTGRALTWNDVVGVQFVEWSKWSRGICEAFSEELTESQWTLKVEARKQARGESGSNYVMDKLVIMRQRSTPLAEKEMIPYLVRGLADAAQRSAIMARDVLTVAELLEQIRRLEVYNYTTGEAGEQPAVPAFVPVSSEQLEAQFRNLKSYLSSQGRAPITFSPVVTSAVAPSTAPANQSNLGAPSFQATVHPPITSRPPTPLTDPNNIPLGNLRQGPSGMSSPVICYKCNLTGHFARECPTLSQTICYNCNQAGHLIRECPNPRQPRGNSGNAAAGPMGQG